MSPTDPPPSQRIEITEGPLRVVVSTAHPEVEMRWAGGPGPIRLRPDPPGAFAALLGRGALASSRGDLKGRAAPAHRLEWLRWEPGGLGLRIAVEVDRQGAGVTLETRLENRGSTPASLAPLRVATVHGELGPLEPFVLWSDGQGHEESLLLGDQGRRPTPWLGFVTGRTGYGRLVMADGIASAACTGSDETLPPGGVLAVDRLFIGVAVSRAAALDDWARRAGAEMEAPVPARGGERGMGRDPRWVDVDHAPGCGARPWRELLARSAEQVSAAGPALASTGLAHAMRPGTRALELAIASQRLWLMDFSADAQQGPRHWLRLLSGLVGGVLRLPDETSEAFRPLCPPLAREATRVAPDVLRVPLLGARMAVLLCNPTPAPRQMGVAFDDLALEGAAHGYDFPANAALGLLSKALPARTVAPGEARLVSLTPPGDRPLVVGSNLHVDMGAAEVAALRETDRGLVLVMRHPGTHSGDVWIARPERVEAQRVPVAFRDQAEIPVPDP